MIDLNHLRAALSSSYTRSLLWIEIELQAEIEAEAEADNKQSASALELSVLKLLQTYGRDSEDLLLLSNRPLAGLTPIRRGEFVRHLGRSYQLIIIDAFSGVNPATLAQAIGTLEGGGLLALVTPPAADWPNYFDPEYLQLGVEPGQRPPGRFIRWLVRALENSSAVLRYSDCCAVPELQPHCPPKRIGHYLGEAQQRTVYQLLTAWQQPRSCTVLDADRGRGKSSTIGLALALQPVFQTQQLALCAPDKRAVASIYQRFRELNDQRILPRFYTPAQLVAQLKSGSTELRCVLVDEAAGVPLQLLEQITAEAQHLVLSSTLHGYEGYARGYGLRFLKQLQESRPECRRLALGEPLRWAVGDILEEWVERYLLLGLERADSKLSEGFYELSLADLPDNEYLLQDIYQLLASAHYRTTPADLRLLLDAPGQRLFMLVIDSELVGVLWVAAEGTLDETLANQVMQGRRRPNGNLLPQSLLHYLGWADAGAKRYWRVVRIAVAQQHRRLGYARAMLQSLQDCAAEQGVDFTGASFAGHADLIEFWRRCGFVSVRRGESIDPVAAQPAVQVLRPVSSRASGWLEYQQRAALSEDALQNFAYHFAPLSLVRERIRQCHPPEQLASILDEMSPSSKRLKPLRAWLREMMESQAS